MRPDHKTEDNHNVIVTKTSSLLSRRRSLLLFCSVRFWRPGPFPLPSRDFLHLIALSVHAPAVGRRAQANTASVCQ